MKKSELNPLVQQLLDLLDKVIKLERNKNE